MPTTCGLHVKCAMGMCVCTGGDICGRGMSYMAEGACMARGACFGQDVYGQEGMHGA